MTSARDGCRVMIFVFLFGVSIYFLVVLLVIAVFQELHDSKTSKTTKNERLFVVSGGLESESYFCHGNCEDNPNLRTKEAIPSHEEFNCENLKMESTILRSKLNPMQQNSKNNVEGKSTGYTYDSASSEFVHGFLEEFCRKNSERYISQSTKVFSIAKKIQFCVGSRDSSTCQLVQTATGEQEMLFYVGAKPRLLIPNVFDRMTGEESEKLEKLRSHTENLEIYKNNRQLSDYLNTDFVYYRFLNSRKFDYEAARIQLEKTLKWRVDNRPEEISLKSLEFLRGETKLMMLPYGYDKEGHPVVYLYLKDFDNIDDDKDWIALFCYFLEYLYSNNLFPEGRYQFTYVVDASRVGLSWINTAERLGKVFREIFGENYPESVYKAHVVNAKWTLRGVYKLAKNFMNSRTKSKFSMNKNSNLLKKSIDEEYLLEEFGGNVRTPRFDFDLMVKREEILERKKDVGVIGVDEEEQREGGWRRKHNWTSKF